VDRAAPAGGGIRASPATPSGATEAASKSVGNEPRGADQGATGTRRGSEVNVRRGFQRLGFGLVLV
jgi:hypothetical protein